MSDESQKGAAEREERLFDLCEAMQTALDEGQRYEDSVWALRFDLELPEVERVRCALELLHAGEDVAAQEVDLPVPNLPEDYEVRGELGRGGMGVVYRVHQKSLGRDLALKVLRPGELLARKTVERFKREARSLARLRHPHIASLHEVGDCEGRVYFTMDLIEGQSLANHLAAGSVTPSQATRWMRQVASALHYVHSHGLVHRDIKPANILIDRGGDACVVDFGLAREMNVSSDLTMSGHFLGTPAYMSPEQARGDNSQVGELSDIYGIGCVLYECLSGVRAFDGNSIVEVVHAVCEGNPTAPTRHDPKVPMGLELICLKAMSRLPESRYPTARALLEDLERFEGGEAVLAEPPSWKHQLVEFWERHRLALRASAWTALTMVILFLVFTFGPGPGLSRPDLLVTAKNLAQTGKTEAALALYEEIFPTDLVGLNEFGRDYADVLLQHAASPSAARVEGALLDSAGRCLALATAALEELKARPIEERLFENTDRLKFDWMVREVRARALLQDADGLSDALIQLRLVTNRLRDDGGEPLPRDVLEGWRGPNVASLLLVEASLVRLLDRDSDGHGRAVQLWGECLSGPAALDVRSWMLESLESPERILAALLRSSHLIGDPTLQSGLLDVQSSGGKFWAHLLSRCDQQALREELRAALEDPRLNGEERLIVKKFCVSHLELPMGLWREVPEDAMRRLFEEEGRVELGQWERRVECVAQLLEAHPELELKPVLDWVRLSTHHRGLRTASENAGELARSLREVDWTRELDDALEVKPDVTGRELLGRMQAEGRRLHRRAWHERMKRASGSGRPLPCWPSASVEPEGLLDAWNEFFADDASAQALRLRVAAFRFGAFATEAQLRYSTSLEVKPGETFVLPFSMPSETWCWEPNVELSRIWKGTYPEAPLLQGELRGALHQREDDLRLEWRRPVLPVTLGGKVGVHLPGSGRGSLQGEIGVAGYFEFSRATLHSPKGGWRRFNVGEELWLTSWESLDGAQTEWGSKEWARRLQEQAQATGRTADKRLLELLLGISTPRQDSRSTGHRGLTKRLWLSTMESATREGIGTALEFDEYPGDLRLALLGELDKSGAALSESEQRQLERLQVKQSDLEFEGTTLKVVIGVGTFIIVGGLLGALRQLLAYIRAGQWRTRLIAQTREQRQAGALMLALNMVLYAAQGELFVGITGGWTSLLFTFSVWLYLVVVVFTLWGLRKRAVIVAGGVGVLVALFASRDHLGASFAWSWSSWLALSLLPVMLSSMWSWHPDAARGRRRGRVANWIFALGYTLPRAWIALAPVTWGGVAGAAPYGTTQIVVLVVTYLVVLGWVIALLSATKIRRKRISEDLAKQNRLQVRERIALTKRTA
ncbi:MAG: putative Ser/Thr protein kinase [Candidatus Paceibacteria bacterium]|jgi:predicted Ser/Thr protein kinase